MGKKDNTTKIKEIPMRKLGRGVITVLVIGAFFVFLGLSGCQKKEGPAEQAGKQIDKTLEKAGQQMEKAGDKIEEAMKDASKK